MRKKLIDWVRIYGLEEHYYTICKRRIIAGVGIRSGRTVLLTEEEFEKVLMTPLYGCKEVVYAYKV